MSKAIHNFYAKFGGWVMFDRSVLTDAIRIYLDAENDLLSKTFTDEHSYNHLIEVGCGYGRFMKWAGDRKYDYSGIDIVDWFVDLAQARIDSHQATDSQLNCHVYNLSAESIAEIAFEREAFDTISSKIVFFPFNCFGNTNSLSATIESLRDLGCDVLISTFKTDDSSSMIRKEYYGKCGYTNLVLSKHDNGALITSDEGLVSYAYELDFLQQLFRENGFEDPAVTDFASIGRAFHFKFKTRPRDVQPERRSFRRQNAIRSLKLMVFEDTSSDDSKSQLMPMHVMDSITKDFSLNSLRITVNKPFAAGNILKMDLSSEKSGKGKPIHLVGQITKIVVLNDGNFDLIIKLFNLSDDSRKQLRSFLNNLRTKS